MYSKKGKTNYTNKQKLLWGLGVYTFKLAVTPIAMSSNTAIGVAGLKDGGLPRFIAATCIVCEHISVKAHA